MNLILAVRIRIKAYFVIDSKWLNSKWIVYQEMEWKKRKIWKLTILLFLSSATDILVSTQPNRTTVFVKLSFLLSIWIIIYSLSVIVLLDVILCWRTENKVRKNGSLLTKNIMNKRIEFKMLHFALSFLRVRHSIELNNFYVN